MPGPPLEAPPRAPRRLDWTRYYREEHELHRFIPAQDPYEDHRVALAELLLEDVRRIAGRSPVRVLDVGCGDGNLVRTWIERHGLDVLGCDLAPARLEYARRLGAGSFAAARADQLPLRAGAVDAVVLIEVLEHLEDPIAVLEELARVTRGFLILTVPHDQELVVKQCPHCLGRFHLDGHIQRFDPARLRRVCERAGLALRSLRSYTVPPRWESSAVGRRLPAAIRRVFNRTLVRTHLMAPRKPKYLGVVAERVER